MSTYPPDWSAISLRVRGEAGFRCVRCGHPTDRPGQLVPCDARCTHAATPVKQRMLTVHHLDGDKANCEWWNLAALCQVCHLQIQGKVIMGRTWMFGHSAWFQPYVAGYYARQLGLCDERDYVLVNMELLIALGQGWGSHA